MDTTMELDDFKSVWQQLDRRLELDNRLQLQALRERSSNTMSRALRPLFWGQIAQILFALPLLALASLLWISQPIHLSTIVAGVLLHAYGVLTIIGAGVVLGQLHKIDYTQPVLEIQTQLLRTRTLYIRSGLIGGLPWWFLWVTILQVLTGLGDVDLLDKVPSLVWSGYAIGLAGLAATAWFHRWARQPERAAFGQKMDDCLTGGSLRKALSQLEALRQFEHS